MKPKRLKAVFDLLLDEVSRNPELAARVERALGEPPAGKAVAKKKSGGAKRATRGKNRRTPAVLDPVTVIQQGKDRLVEQLQALDLEQLRDIVAEHGMDPQRLVMKWKATDKVIEHIVGMAEQRSRKGEAFRS